MKGLIRNNFYSVGSSLKWSIAFCIIANIAVILGAIRYPSIDTILTILILGEIGAFVGLTGTALQKDNSSKWSKFERTLPVKICDVVMARYISFLAFSMIGILLASITVLFTSTVVDQPLNLERVGYGFGFGITFALLVPAILYPLVLKFGADKSEIMLMVSIIITMCLYFGASAIFGGYLNKLDNGNLIFRVACIVISMVAFILSYFISVYIVKRKEY